MFGWLQRGGRTPGWLAVSLDEASIEFAHARRVRGARPKVSPYAALSLDGAKSSVDRVMREFKLGGYQYSTMLRAHEYDLRLVDAPNVPRGEWKSALRWKVKDTVTYPVAEATIDFLEIPAQAAPTEGRPAQLYAVLARNELIQARVRKFDDAGLPLAVIDIPETAQRNLATLYEEGERAVALAYFGAESGLLTITHRGELCLARRLELGLPELTADLDGAEGGPHERVVLEIQRTLDHFERQFRDVAVGKLLLAPTGHPTRLREMLAERFEMPVQQIDLTEVLAFGPGEPNEETQWRLFHHFGAALRDTAT